MPPGIGYRQKPRIGDSLLGIGRGAARIGKGIGDFFIDEEVGPEGGPGLSNKGLALLGAANLFPMALGPATFAGRLALMNQQRLFNLAGTREAALQTNRFTPPDEPQEQVTRSALSGDYVPGAGDLPAFDTIVRNRMNQRSPVTAQGANRLLASRLGGLDDTGIRQSPFADTSVNAQQLAGGGATAGQTFRPAPRTPQYYDSLIGTEGIEGAQNIAIRDIAVANAEQQKKLASQKLAREAEQAQFDRLKDLEKIRLDRGKEAREERTADRADRQTDISEAGHDLNVRKSSLGYLESVEKMKAQVAKSLKDDPANLPRYTQAKTAAIERYADRIRPLLPNLDITYSDSILFGRTANYDEIVAALREVDPNLAGDVESFMLQQYAGFSAGDVTAPEVRGSNRAISPVDKGFPPFVPRLQDNRIYSTVLEGLPDEIRYTDNINEVIAEAMLESGVTTTNELIQYIIENFGIE